MSRDSVSKVIERAISDAAFRRQLTSDPKSALAGFDLTKDERSAITGGDPGKLTALGVDQRMSKAFGLSGVAASKAAAVDDISGGGSASAVVDEATGGNAFQQNLRRIEGDLDTANTAAAADTGANALRQNLQRIEKDLDMGTTAAAKAPVDVSGDFSRFDPGVVSGTATSTSGGASNSGASAFEPEAASGLDLSMIDPGTVSGTDVAGVQVTPAGPTTTDAQGNTITE